MSEIKVDMSSPATFIEHFVPRVTYGRAVDLGFGAGEQSVLLAVLGYTVDAVDNNSLYLETLRQLAHDENLPICFHHECVQDFLARTGDSTIDVLVAINLLHADDQDDTLLYFSQFDSVIRVLKPGGRLLCTLLKFCRDKEGALPTPLAQITTDALESVWGNRLRVIYYDPERPNEESSWLCYWDLVAEKL